MLSATIRSIIKLTENDFCLAESYQMKMASLKTRVVGNACIGGKFSESSFNVEKPQTGKVSVLNRLRGREVVNGDIAHWLNRKTWCF